MDGLCDDEIEGLIEELILGEREGEIELDGL